jgi:hypothetical protein
MKRLRLHPAAPALQALNERSFSWEASSAWDIAHHIFFAGGNPKCSKNARWKTAARRSTDRPNRPLNVSNLWLDDDSALIPDSSLTLAGAKLRLTPALHRGLLRRSTDESGLPPTWNTRKSMLVAGFSQFNKTCFSTKTLLFAPGCRNRESGGSGATGFGSVRHPGTGLFVGGSRFVEAVACIGPAVGPSGHAGLVRRVDRSLKYGGASLLVVMSRTPH